VTVCTTHPLDLAICKIWSLYQTNRRYKGSQNISNFRGALKIRGDLCTPVSRKR